MLYGIKYCRDENGYTKKDRITKIIRKKVEITHSREPHGLDINGGSQ